MSQLSSNPVLHAMIPRLGDDYASIIILCMSFQLEDLTMFRFRDLVDAETLDHTRSLDIETLVSKFRIHHDQLTQCRAAFAETVNSYSTTTGKGIGVPIFSSSRIVSLFLSFLVYKNLIFEVLKTFNLIQNELKRNQWIKDTHPAVFAEFSAMMISDIFEFGFFAKTKDSAYHDLLNKLNYHVYRKMNEQVLPKFFGTKE